jgi:hypothetical protein
MLMFCFRLDSFGNQRSPRVSRIIDLAVFTLQTGDRPRHISSASDRYAVFKQQSCCKLLPLLTEESIT